MSDWPSTSKSLVRKSKPRYNFHMRLLDSSGGGSFSECSNHNTEIAGVQGKLFHLSKKQNKSDKSVMISPPSQVTSLSRASVSMTVRMHDFRSSGLQILVVRSRYALILLMPRPRLAVQNATSGRPDFVHRRHGESRDSVMLRTGMMRLVDWHSSVHDFWSNCLFVDVMVRMFAFDARSCGSGVPGFRRHGGVFERRTLRAALITVGDMQPCGKKFLKLLVAGMYAVDDFSLGSSNLWKLTAANQLEAC